jgi:hypothetical protein
MSTVFKRILEVQCHVQLDRWRQISSRVFERADEFVRRAVEKVERTMPPAALLLLCRLCIRLFLRHFDIVNIATPFFTKHSNGFEIIQKKQIA